MCGRVKAGNPNTVMNETSLPQAATPSAVPFGFHALRSFDRLADSLPIGIYT